MAKKRKAAPPPQNELKRQGITAAEVKRRAAEDEPIVQSGLRNATLFQRALSAAANLTGGLAEGVAELPALAADIGMAASNPALTGARIGAGYATGGLGGAVESGAPATAAVGRGADKFISALKSAAGIDQDVVTGWQDETSRLLGNVVAPGPEVAQGGKAVRKAATAAAPSPATTATTATRALDPDYEVDALLTELGADPSMQRYQEITATLENLIGRAELERALDDMYPTAAELLPPAFNLDEIGELRALMFAPEATQEFVDAIVRNLRLRGYRDDDLLDIVPERFTIPPALHANAAPAAQADLAGMTPDELAREYYEGPADVERLDEIYNRWTRATGRPGTEFPTHAEIGNGELPDGAQWLERRRQHRRMTFEELHNRYHDINRPADAEAGDIMDELLRRGWRTHEVLQPPAGRIAGGVPTMNPNRQEFWEALPHNRFLRHADDALPTDPATRKYVVSKLMELGKNGDYMWDARDVLSHYGIDWEGVTGALRTTPELLGRVQISSDLSHVQPDQIVPPQAPNRLATHYTNRAYANAPEDYVLASGKPANRPLSIAPPPTGDWYYDNIENALQSIQPKFTTEQLAAHLKKFSGALQESGEIGYLANFAPGQKITKDEALQLIERLKPRVNVATFKDPTGNVSRKDLDEAYTNRDRTRLDYPELADLGAGANPYASGVYMMHGKGNYDVPVQSTADVFYVPEDYLPPPEGPYYGFHWGDKGVPNDIGHLRTTDRATTEGEKLLFGEEFQSDLHQAGQKHGYRDPVAYAKARKQADEIAARMDEIEAQLDEFRPENSSVSNWPSYVEALRESAAVRPSAKQASQELSKFDRAVPALPLKGDLWTKLQLKKLFWNAANRDDVAGVGWTVGKYNSNYHEGAKNAPGMEKYYDQKVQNLANEILKPFGAKVETRNVPGTGDEAADLSERIISRSPTTPIWYVNLPDNIKQAIREKRFPLYLLAGAAAGMQGGTELLDKQQPTPPPGAPKKVY